jgi:pentapeptide MXKDX repeat protein
MNQVFMNILANAIDALEDGNRDRSFADIQANPNRISVQTAVINNGSQVAIHIADNGTGMTEAVRQHIFDHFTTKPVGQGTGLGLSIVQQIVVEHHGGQLQVNSAPGEGAEFVIHLPIQGRHAAERQPADELLADRLKANEAEAVPVLTRDEAAEAARPDEMRPDEMRPDEMRPDEMRPDEMRPDEMRSDEMRPDEMRSHQPVSPSL